MKKPLLTCVALAGAAALALGALGGLGARATGGHEPASEQCELSVVGLGEVAREPDRAQVTLGAVFEADTAGEAQLRVNRVLGRVIEDVRELDIPGTVIQTASISISPVYHRPRNAAPD